MLLTGSVMNKKWLRINLIVFMLISTRLIAAISIPIQRIDVANLLTTGAIGSSVILAFNNGETNPCSIIQLKYQETATLWAGAGQPCLEAITSFTVMPIDSGGVGTIYQTPGTPIMIGENFYSTRLIITQNIAPLFDAINGAIITPGTIQTSVVSHFG